MDRAGAVRSSAVAADALTWWMQVRQPRGQRAFEESPDITGQGGRDIDPGKPAGKCHRNKPPTSAVPTVRPAGKGEMVRQERTSVAVTRRLGKPHPMQGQTGPLAGSPPRSR